MLNDYSRLRFALYTRKSSEEEDRQVLSNLSQLENLHEYANRCGFNIVEEYTDSASAHLVDNREGFKNLLRDISRGKINAILTWKADRLSRNMVEGGQVIHLLQTKQIDLIATPHAKYHPFDNTLPLTVEFGMANQFSRDLSVNVKRGMKTKAEKGGWCGVAPQGYLNDRINKTIEPDPDRFKLVRKMWDLALTKNHSLSQICSILNDKYGYRTLKRKRSGNRPLSISSLYQILTNPFYTGVVVFQGIRFRGNHKRMVSDAEFDQVQEMFDTSGRKAETNHKFAFTDMIHCDECECSITAELKVKYACPTCRLQHSSKKPKTCWRCGERIPQEAIDDGNYYTYYRCTKKKGSCSQKYMRKEKLEELLIAQLRKIQMDEDIAAWIRKWVPVVHQKTINRQGGEIDQIKKEIAHLDVRLDNLLDAYLDGVVNRTKFQKRESEYLKEKRIWNERLNNLRSKRPKWIVKLDKDLDIITEVARKFQTVKILEKKRIVRSVGSNLRLSGQTLTLELKPQFQILTKGMDISPPRLEPSLSQSQTEKLDMFELQKISWYPWLMEILTFYQNG